MVHYLKLNPNCTSEAYDNKFVIVLYDLQGNIIDKKEAALLYEMWEYEKYVYCKIDSENNLNIRSVEFKHDYEANTNEVIRASDSFTLHKKGVVKSN